MGEEETYSLIHISTPVYKDIHIPCCSVAKSCLTLFNPMDCSMLGFPVLYHVLEFAQTGPLSWWCHPTISSSVVPFSSCLQSFPASWSFPMNWLFIRGSQSIGALASVLPMNISFRINWFDLLAAQGTLKSFSTSQFKSIKSLALSLLYGPTLTPIHDYWKNHSFDYMDLCQQSDVSAF